MSSHDESSAFEGASLAARAMAARPAPYLDDLNPEQRRAAETLDGPVLMLAGAGTGKTKALTTRIVHLLNTGRARPNEILAVTFTNKAAREMKTRVSQLMGQPVEGMPWLGTFHAICVKLLRRHAELAQLSSNFTILDRDDQLRLLKQLVQAANIDDKRWPARQLAGIIDQWKNRALTPDNLPASEATAYDGKGPALYRQYQTRLRELNAVDFGDLLLHVVTIFQTHHDVLAQYQRRFRYILVDEYQDTNVAQYLWLRLLAGGHKNICCVGDDDQSIYGWRGAEVGNILRFESDFPGAAVIRLEQNYRSTPHILAAAGGVISANSGRLGKELWTQAEEGKKVRLIGHWDGDEEARWIGEKIEDHLSGRSQEAKDRYNPRLESFEQELDRRAKAGLGPISEQEFVKHAFETGKVYNDIKIRNLIINLLKDDPKAENMLKSVSTSKEFKFSPEEIAILVRASHQMRAFEDRFLTIGMPYRVIGGPRFYERQEIRDAMAYFRLVTSPADDLAFERIVNTPKRGLGDKAVQTIQVTSRENQVSLLEGSRMCCRKKLLRGKALSELSNFINLVDLWSFLVRSAGDKYQTAQFENDIFELSLEIDHLNALHPSDKLTAEERSERIDQIRSRVEVLSDFVAILEGDHILLAHKILDESGYTEMWQNDKTPEAPGRLENLKELVKALEGFENLQGFLEHVSLIMDNESDEAEEKVTLMTLHAAKGLEFPAIFLPGWEDGLFPSQRSMDENGTRGLEEERRLAYVGITRAEEVCTISFAGNRRVYGQWQSQMPSRFIDELPEAHVEVLTPPGLYGGGYGAASPGIETRAAEANVYNSPGWRRLQARASERPMTQPREARSPVIDTQAVSSHTVGARVFHQKFGYGTIAGIEGDKLEVTFDKAGTKKIVARFISGAEDVPF